jgi:membrane complex biogenesis BtpA family protein
MRGLIGVIHLLPLPGDPGHAGGGFAAAYERARSDAEAMVRGGIDGLIVENFGSAPFVKGTGQERIPAHQAVAIAHVAQACKQLGVPVGVNCLRNDGITAVGIAAACALDFVRINVHTGAYVTDQGLIEGEAHATLRHRMALGATQVEIWADVLVKHAAPLAPIDPETATRDCVERGLADAVVVTGSATGQSVDPKLLERVRSACAGRPVVIGSGLSPFNAPQLLPLAEAAIVGTWIKRDGLVRNEVDPERVNALVEACRGRLGGCGS